ncbi:MAG: hypothetical protein QOJ54_1744, partial [Aliidongia sp.]|nr:hypothetical protein [Aliidongia sp.]
MNIIHLCSGKIGLSIVATGSCVICGGTKVHYNFSLGNFRIEECSACKLMRLAPQPSDAELREIYGARYFLMSDDVSARNHVSDLKSATADDYLTLIETEAARPLTGDLLEIGCGQGEFLLRAAERGLSVTGLEYSPAAAAVAARRIGQRGRVVVGDISDAPSLGQSFDFIVFADVLEHVRDPRAFLRSVHSLLKPGGIAVIVVPNLDSLSAKLLGTSWMEFKVEHL